MNDTSEPISTTTTTTPAFAPSDHHPLGPSTWPARAECACFEPQKDVDLEDVDGESQEDNTPRGRGVVKHKAVAMLLSGDLATRQQALVGLTDREIDEVQWVVAKCLEIVESNGYTQADLRLEQRVTMPKPDSFEPLYFGTGDGEAGPLDFDWKFAEKRNYFAQLVGYALPKMEARGEQRRYAFILNGRYKVVERYVLDRKTVETVGYGLLAKVTSPHKRPTPCSYCGFCNNRLTCSAFTAVPETLVQRREDWAMKLPSAHVSLLRDPVALGAARFVWKAYLEKWGDAVEWACSTLLEAGGTAPVGFNVRKEKGRQTVGDARKAFAAIKDVVGEDVLWEQMSFSIGSVAKAHAARVGVSEDKAKALILRHLVDAGAIHVGDPITKLVMDKNAEELIRAALGKTRAPELPDPVLDISAQPSAVASVKTDSQQPPEGARS